MTGWNEPTFKQTFDNLEPIPVKLSPYFSRQNFIARHYLYGIWSPDVKDEFSLLPIKVNSMIVLESSRGDMLRELRMPCLPLVTLDNTVRCFSLRMGVDPLNAGVLVPTLLSRKLARML